MAPGLRCLRRATSIRPKKNIGIQLPCVQLDLLAPVIKIGSKDLDG